ncbi:MAG: TMEM43 family protein [Chthoniobacterales bacterium]
MGSLAGVIIGILLILAAVILLWWNEGNAVKTAKGLREGAAAVVSIQPDTVSPANNHKLVHLTGMATTAEVLRDPLFHISANAIRLDRNVQMYQWKEEKESTTHNKLGGGTETKTTYKYEKTWSGERIDSSKFKHPEDHENPDHMLAPSKAVDAKNVTLGAFALSAKIISQMTGDEPLELSDADLEKLPSKLRSAAQLSGNMLYFGKEPESPAVGDQKVDFQILKPAVFSIIGMQTDNTFEPFGTHTGTEILLVESGTVSAQGMFQHAESANVVLTWILRLVGFILMAIGFGLMLGPIGTLASVIPLLGDIVGAGTGLASFLLAGIGSVLIIALAWIAYRPLFGVILLLLGIGGVIFARRLGSRKIAAAQK